MCVGGGREGMEIYSHKANECCDKISVEKEKQHAIDWVGEQDTSS